MTRARFPGRVRPETAPASLLAISLLAISLLPVLSPVLPAAAGTATSTATSTVTSTKTAVAAASTAATPTPPVAVSLAGITPTVAGPKSAVTIRGSVRNTGTVSITAPMARVLIGQRSLSSRHAVSDWANGTGEPSLNEVAHTPLGASLAPGSVATFTLTIPATKISHRESFAVLPLRIDASGTTLGETTRLGDVHTFIPALALVKEYVPLSIAWLVPLTLDPAPALHGLNSPARTAAWTKAIGPGSRLDRLIQGTEHENVTWAIDPAILGAPQNPSATGGTATPNPTPSTSKAPTQGTAPVPDPVAAETAGLARRLKAAAPLHTLWSLPYADPDLAALLLIAAGNRLVTALIGRPSTLNTAVGPARTDIAWPVEGKVTPRNEAYLRKAFSAEGLAGAVTSAATLTDRNGTTENASRKTSGGLPLLAYDEALSGTVAQTSSRTAGTITIQRFLADSMALLGERPGSRNRSVLVAEPRTFAGDPAVLRSLFAAVAKAPWLAPVTTEQLLASSEKLEPEPPGADTTTTPSPSAPSSPTTPNPMTPSGSPLTADQLATMPGTMSAIAGIASILMDAPLFTARWTDAQIQLLSARWRGHPDGITAIDTATTTAISEVSDSVRVAPSSVNFFADRGVMQVTVVNDLAVPIRNVRLTLTPAQPRLRIEQQPGPLRIGAKSRANVKVHVTSIAAGLIRINADLSTPNGTPLGENASVAVRVQPPSTWIYWALGGLGGLILVLGTYRSLRRGSTRGSRPDAQEPPLDDRVLND